jgi:hypothetical protein
MRPPEERRYIAVPTLQELVDHFGLESIDQAEAEIEARLHVASALARLTQTNIQSAVDWRKTQTHAIVLAAEGVSVTLYRPPYEYGISVDVPNTSHTNNFNTLYLGAKLLTDAGCAASEARDSLEEEPSNDYLWHVKLAEHTRRLHTNPNETGSFYAENNGNIYGWFAFGKHGYPRTEAQFFADPRLYLGARDKVIRELRRFDFSRSALFDSIITGTIFTRNNQPAPPLAASHPV